MTSPATPSEPAPRRAASPLPDPAEPDSGAASPSIRRVHRLFLAALVAAYTLAGILTVDHADDASLMDTGVYLTGAIGLADLGGIPGFFRGCITGEFTESEQNPLFYLILSPIARRDIRFFAEAKLVTLLTGLAALLAFHGVVTRLRGPLAAAFASTFLALNATFLRLSSMVTVEPLLLLWVILTWYWTVRGFETERGWLKAGAATGLAFLSKGPGLFLLPSFTLTALVGSRLAALRSRKFWLFFAAFVGVGSPLFLRNTLSYGSPIYNFNNYSLWADEWDPDAIRANPPTFWTYVQTHTAREAAQRFTTGLYEQLVTLHRITNNATLAFDPRAVLNDTQPRTTLSAVFLLTALVALTADRRDRRSGLFAAIHCGVFLALFSWAHQILGDPRFLLPLLPFVYFYAALPLAGLLRRFPRATLSALALGLALFSVSLPLRYAYANPLHSYRRDDGEEELQRYLESHIRPGDVYLFDTLVYDDERYHGSARYEFRWHAHIEPDSREIANYPELSSPAEFRAFLQREGVTLLVIARHNVTPHRPYLRHYFDWHPTEGLVVRRPLIGWREVFRDPTPPVAYRVFRRWGRDDAPSPAHPPGVEAAPKLVPPEPGHRSPSGSGENP